MKNPPVGFTEIKECPRWYINEKGEVWSGKVNRHLSPHDNGRGYKQLIYNDKNNRKKHYIHRLVASEFIGEIPLGYTVNHKDGDTANNHVNNLEIITHKENNYHAIKTGLNTKWRGSRHPQAKLTEGDVITIRSLIDRNTSRRSIAERFDISEGTVSDIKHKKSWKWLA